MPNVLQLDANYLADTAQLRAGETPIVWREGGLLRLAPGVRTVVGSFTANLILSCKRAAPWIGPHPAVVLEVPSHIDIDQVELIKDQDAADVQGLRIAYAVESVLRDAGIALPAFLRDAVRSVVSVSLSPIE